jgi:integrase
MVWEPERAERWKATGEVPCPVMVWTDELLGELLDYAAIHAPDLHPMWQFMAYRGPRRGEACGLLDAEVRLGKAEVGFRRLIIRTGLPPVRVHDLRHGAATIALDAGVDIKVVSEQLGHTTTTLTRDTYQSVAKHLHHDAAGAVAERIKNKRRRVEGNVVHLQRDTDVA